jgi:hypothetical protein
VATGAAGRCAFALPENPMNAAASATDTILLMSLSSSRAPLRLAGGHAHFEKILSLCQWFIT